MKPYLKCKEKAIGIQFKARVKGLIYFLGQPGFESVRADLFYALNF